jgi:hypothetical protein
MEFHFRIEIWRLARVVLRGETPKRILAVMGVVTSAVRMPTAMAKLQVKPGYSLTRLVRTDRQCGVSLGGQSASSKNLGILGFQ